MLKTLVSGEHFLGKGPWQVTFIRFPTHIGKPEFLCPYNVGHVFSVRHHFLPTLRALRAVSGFQKECRFLTIQNTNPSSHMFFLEDLDSFSFHLSTETS